MQKFITEQEAGTQWIWMMPEEIHQLLEPRELIDRTADPRPDHAIAA